MPTVYIKCKQSTIIFTKFHVIYPNKFIKLLLVPYIL